MFRLLVASIVIACVGCSSVLPESADAKAIKERVRQNAGDRSKVSISNVRPAGDCSEFDELIDFGSGFTKWGDCQSKGRCSYFDTAVSEDLLAVFDEAGNCTRIIADYRRKVPEK